MAAKRKSLRRTLRRQMTPAAYRKSLAKAKRITAADQRRVLKRRTSIAMYLGLLEVMTPGISDPAARRATAKFTKAMRAAMAAGILR